MFIKKQEERRHAQQSHFDVAQPSRLRVRTASRRSQRYGAGTPRELAGGTPALRQNESCSRQASCSVFARDQKLSIETRRLSRASLLTRWHNLEQSHVSITLD